MDWLDVLAVQGTLKCDVNGYSYYGKQYGISLTKQNIGSSNFNSGYIWKMKPVFQRDICISTFIVVLFTRAKTWKQPKCPLMDEWIKKSIGLPWWLSGKESTCDLGATRDAGSIPGLGRYPGGICGNPLQSFCIDNHIDRGAWWATLHRVTKKWTRLKRLNRT